MRLDFFLTASRLVKRRSAAKALIENGAVICGGAPAKAGRPLREGDELELRVGRREIRIRVLATAERRVSKTGARELYEVIEERRAENVPPETDSDGPIDFLASR